MASQALVSVIIPTYNRLAFLGEALESVLAQTHSNLEIIVVDDGSTDSTGDYVRGLASDRVIYHRLEHRGRPAPARNAGLEMATGEFIAFLDSDDQWLPDKTETQVRTLQKNPQFDLVATDLYEVPARKLRPLLGLRESQVVAFRDLLRNNPIANSSVVVRRSVVDAVGLLDESEEMRGLEDYEYWLRVLRRREGSALILAQPLILYRRHGGNIGIEDVERCDRLSAIVARHRDYDPAYVDTVIEGLEDQKVFRQALFDMTEGATSFVKVVLRRDLRPLDRLRLVKQRLLKLGRGTAPA